MTTENSTRVLPEKPAQTQERQQTVRYLNKTFTERDHPIAVALIRQLRGLS